MQDIRQEHVYPPWNKLTGSEKQKQNVSCSLSRKAVLKIGSYQSDLLLMESMPDTTNELRKSETVIISTRKARALDKIAEEHPDLVEEALKQID